MRALLINPTDHTITETEFNGDFHDISRQIDSEFFDCVRIGDRNQNNIYVDDNGLNNDKWRTAGMFRVDGDNPVYLAGKGLIIGTNKNGESIACDLDIETFKSRIAFGEPCRVNGGLVFVELEHGQAISPAAFMFNRFWAMD